MFFKKLTDNVTNFRPYFDFANVCFLFFAFQLYNGPFLFLTTWAYVFVYSFFLVGNAYVCSDMARLKSHVIKRVLEGFDRQTENNPDRKHLVENALQRNLQWSDLGEMAFGKLFGRFVVDCSLFIAVFTAAIGQIFSLRLTLMDRIECNDFANVTQLTSMHCPSNDYVVKLTSIPTFTLYILPVLCLSAFLPNYRWVGIFSMVGICCVMLSQFSVFLPTFTSVADEERMAGVEDPSAAFWFMSCMPQVGAIMMTIHGSLHPNKQLFGRAVSCAALLSIIPIVMAIFLLEKNGVDLDRIVTRNFYTSFSLQMEMFTTLVILCFLINFPLSQMIERWLGKRDVRTRYLLDDSGSYYLTPELNIFDPVLERSVFDQLRNNPQAKLWASGILSDVEVKTVYKRRFVIQFSLVLAEFGCAILSLLYVEINYIVSYLEATSGVFFGFVIPFSISLRLRWSELSALDKVVPMMIAFLAILMCYLAAFNEIDIFMPTVTLI